MITYVPHEFAVGVHTVIWTATDASGNSATTTSQVTITDLTKPVINFHGPVIAEATSPAGAAVTYTAPDAVDLVDGTFPATCLPVSGSTFPLGPTSVTCVATDFAGNAATSTTFTVTVVDTTPPVIGAHADEPATADSLGGATVTYTAPLWTDAVDGSGSALCAPASGTFFVLGPTTVTCTQTDVAGNPAIPVTFTVTVNPVFIASLSVSAVSPVTTGDTSTVTVNGLDVFGNVTINQSGTIVVVSVDNGGLLSAPLITLVNGVATTNLTKDSAGAVNVTVSSGILTPDTTVVGFTAVPVPPPTGISVDLIMPDPQNISASANDSYLDGWHYVFQVTVNNTAETNLFVKFVDWVNAASSSLTVPISGNTRLLVNEAGGIVAPVGLTDADIASGFGTVVSYGLGNTYGAQTAGPSDISAVDLNPTTAGRQVQFDVFTKLPLSTAPGAYGTTFGICTDVPGGTACTP